MGATKNPKDFLVTFIEEGSTNLATNRGLKQFWDKACLPIDIRGPAILSQPALELGFFPPYGLSD